jgi:hemolysin III
MAQMQLPVDPLAPCPSPYGQLLPEVKPRLRGWLHVGIAPLALVGGVLLVLLSPAGAPRVGAAVFATSAVTLFTVSAAMHRGRWSPGTARLLTRMDHAGIFLLIAGTYTPFALLLLRGRAQVVLLTVVWAGAAGGIAFRMLRPRAARWVYTPLYLALGWVAVAYAPAFARDAGPVVLVLIAVGGLLYTAGAVVYGLRWPNPVPLWFGFHEVFHAFTVLAFAAHYTGIAVATCALR